MELGENGKTEKLRKFEKIEIIPKNRFFGGWHFRPLKTRRKNKSWIFFNSDRVNSISMLQSAPKLLSNLIKYSFQWQRNDFKYSSWNSWIFVMFDKKERFTESKFWISNTKTIMVFRKLDNSKDDHYQILVWYFRLFYGSVIESRTNICRTLSSFDIAVLFTTILTARYRIRFFSGSILDHTVKSANHNIQNCQRTVLMPIWKLDTRKLVAKAAQLKNYFHLKTTRVKFIFILERFNKQYEHNSVFSWKYLSNFPNENVTESLLWSLILGIPRFPPKWIILNSL